MESFKANIGFEMDGSASSIGGSWDQLRDGLSKQAFSDYLEKLAFEEAQERVCAWVDEADLERLWGEYQAQQKNS